MTETVPDFMRPAPLDDEYERLLEMEQRILQMMGTQAWREYADFILQIAHKEERQVFAGTLSHDEYVRRAATANALNFAADPRDRIRTFVEARKPPQEGDDE